MKKSIIAIAKTIVILWIFMVLDIYLLGDYGYILFVLIPFLLGFLPVVLYKGNELATVKETILLGFGAVTVMIITLLVFAMEGLICIAVALPLVMALSALGSYVAYAFYKKKKNVVLVALLTLSTFCISMDTLPPTGQLTSVVTRIEVDAPVREVWENVVTFGEIGEVKDWLFKTGIAYPISASVEGEGVGAIRYCNFTTGPFIEPITVWEPPYLLAFDVIEQPIPMEEWNPFWEIHPPHLDGYFQSEKGQFKLIPLDNNRTLLEDK